MKKKRRILPPVGVDCRFQYKKDTVYAGTVYRVEYPWVLIGHGGLDEVVNLKHVTYYDSIDVNGAFDGCK